MKILLLLFLFLFLSFTGAQADQRAFSHFSANLPDGWDGDEQEGFISDRRDEYLLTFGRKDEAKDAFIAQVSIYLLPNKPGVDTETAAKTLAEAQAEPSVPVREGNFMTFTGEPRSRTIKGRATTMVNATPEALMIIIAQDPGDTGSKAIISSLKGETELARKMLGR